MVLTELATKLQSAVKKMRNTSIVSKEVIDELLRDITNTLLTADVSFEMAINLRNNLEKRLDPSTMPNGDKRRIVQKAIHEELCALLDPGIAPFKPERGRQNVVMFVGLQGAGKTTTIMKYANHYKKRGFRPALICCDTFRAGAFAQLKQNATRAQVPFYGDEDESDPVKLAEDGVRTFIESGMDLIIVDTSGRHKQEEGLFAEMEQIRSGITPDVIILVMDGAMGQSAGDHAEAFKNSVDVGGCIITKLDDRNAKGGAALSAVAMTQSPILFLGTGEDMDDLDEFDPKSFAGQLLGIADINRVFEFVKTNVTDTPTKEDISRMSKGDYTFRDFQKQLDSVKDMPLNKFMGMMGMNSSLFNGDDGKEKMRQMTVMLDSMTEKELDNPDLLLSSKTKKSRCERVARGSGRPINEFNQLVTAFKQLKKGLKVAASAGKNRRGMASQMGQIQKAMGNMGMGNMGMGNIDMKALMEMAKQQQ